VRAAYTTEYVTLSRVHRVRAAYTTEYVTLSRVHRVRAAYTEYVTCTPSTRQVRRGRIRVYATYTECVAYTLYALPTRSHLSLPFSSLSSDQPISTVAGGYRGLPLFYFVLNSVWLNYSVWLSVWLN